MINKENYKDLTEEGKEKYQELIDEGTDQDAIQAYIDLGIGDDNLDNFEESYQGQWPTDEAFAQEIAEDIGAVENNSSWPNYCIDWEWASRELMMDYSEDNGYYFRCL